jgi:hypothetical protein
LIVPNTSIGCMSRWFVGGDSSTCSTSASMVTTQRDSVLDLLASLNINGRRSSLLVGEDCVIGVCRACAWPLLTSVIAFVDGTNDCVLWVYRVHACGGGRGGEVQLIFTPIREHTLLIIDPQVWPPRFHIGRSKLELTFSRHRIRFAYHDVVDADAWGR